MNPPLSNEKIKELIKSGYAYIMIKKTEYPFLDYDTSQDILQASLLKLIQAHKKTSIDKIHHYFFTILRNGIIDYGKKLKMESRIENTTIPGESKAVYEQQQEHLERKRIIEQALNRLSIECKQLLVRQYYDEAKMKEIAEELGYTYEFVRVKKTRCIKELRKIIEESIKENT